MKLIQTLLLILIFGSQAFAQGIDFKKGSWEEILAKAEKENKIVFMDAYTTWCGPCKVMDRDIFSAETVGTYFNENFINVKMDMEKGEGIELSKKYQVRGYPTFLFISSNGELLHRAIGLHQEADFVKVGLQASDPNQQIITLDKRYQAGEKDPDFLYHYTIAKSGIGDGSEGPVALEYLDLLEDWESKDSKQFILQYVNDLDSKPMAFLLKNRGNFNDLFGQKIVDARLEKAVSQKIFGGQGGVLRLDDIDAIYKKTFPESAEERSSIFRLTYFERAGDMAKYMETAENYLDQFGGDKWNDLNSIAWTYFEKVEDKTELEKALGWAKKSIALDSNHYNNDTAAALAYKLGQKRPAIKWAKKAIKIAKSQGEDASMTKQMLAEIKKL